MKADDAAAIRSRILMYLTDRRQFEMDLHRRMEGCEGEAASRVALDAERRFLQHLGRHAVPEAHGVMTSDPNGTVDPDAVQWVSIRRSAGRISARTLEVDSVSRAAPAEFEYLLEWSDGRWLLTDRRIRDPLDPRRWIKGLL